jgi:hypothetical protein
MYASAAVPPFFRTASLVLTLVCALSGCSCPFSLGQEGRGFHSARDYADPDYADSFWYLGHPHSTLLIGSSWSFRPHYWPPEAFQDRRDGPPGQAGRRPPDSHGPRPFAGSEQPRGPRESLSPPPRGKADFPGRTNPDSRPRPGARQHLSPDGHRDRTPAVGNPPPERRIQPRNRPERQVSQENRPGGQIRPEGLPGRRLAPREAAGSGGRREIQRAGRTHGRQPRR